MCQVMWLSIYLSYNFKKFILQKKKERSMSLGNILNRLFCKSTLNSIGF